MGTGATGRRARLALLALATSAAACSEGDRRFAPTTASDAAWLPRPDSGQGDGGSVRDGSSADDGAICGEADLPIARVVPEVLVVLDRSGSMLDGGHWTAVREALYDVTGALERRLAFGLMVFPDPGDGVPCGAGGDPCAPGRRPLVLPAVGRADRIRSALEPMVPCGGTPTAGTIEGARASFALDVDPTHLPPAQAVPAFVVLATDGAPNCNPGADDATCRCTGGTASCAGSPSACLDDERTFAAISALRDRGVRLFVVGIAASPFRDVLDEMAGRGGTGAALMAEDEEGMRAAFESITGRVSSCELVVGDLGGSVDRDRVNVSLDGEPLAMDREGSCDEGWRWADEGRSRIVLCGEACERLRRGEVDDVRATFGCPTLIGRAQGQS